jgi:hypothetical protein
MKLWRTDGQVAECSGALQYRDSIRTAICHQNATSKFLALIFLGNLAEREGFEPDSDPSSDQQVTDSENNAVPDDPLKSP